MNLRWLLLDYVDPQLPLTRKERRKIWWQAYGIVWRPRTTKAPPGSKFAWVAIIAQSLAPAVCMFGPLFIWIYSRVPIAGGILAIAIGFVMTWLVTTWLGRFTWKRHINVALREMGFDICPRCGYWLRGLAEHVEQCPECGTIRIPFPSKEHPAS